jgi:molybdopterin-guanine dinucleotide biosynthesis protein A
LKKQEGSVTSKGSEPERHGKLKRPHHGIFGRNEVALVGTTCEEVERIVSGIQKALHPLHVAYVDASHGADFRWNGHASYCVHEGMAEVILPASREPFDARLTLASAHAVAVNGNHFEASRQILVPNEAKKASLERRRSQITHPLAVLLTGALREIPEWLFGFCDVHNLPVLHEDDPSTFETLSTLIYSPPAVNALILTGGFSQRMGRDKSMVEYYGKPHYKWLSEQCRNLGLPVFFSCREEQREQFAMEGCGVITDRLLHTGPLGGIASAFMHDPAAAWLAIACDMPGLDMEGIGALLRARSMSHFATCFAEEAGRPEPLAAIWEPVIYPRLMQFIAQGVDCPRSVLRKSSIAELTPAKADWIRNINTPEEANAFRQNQHGS